MRVEHDGVGLNVEVEGTEDGPVVAFLHGVWRQLTHVRLAPARRSRRDGRILRIDFRGHGDSDHAPGTYLLHTYGEDVAAILREVGGGPAVVVGHSLGGSTGMVAGAERARSCLAARSSRTRRSTWASPPST